MFKLLNNNYYLRLFWRYMYLNWQREAAYVVNYWAMVGSEVLFIVLNILYLYLIFKAGGLEYLGGFTIYDFYFISALAELVWLFGAIFSLPSMVLFKYEIYSGELDFVLLRPKSWFIANIRASWLATSVMNFVYFGILIWYVFDKVSLDLYSWNWLYVLLLFAYGLILYCLLYWVAGLVCFYSNHFDALHSWLGTSQDVKFYPSKIYPQWMRFIYRAVLPVMLVVNPVYDLIDGKMDFGYILYLILVLIVFILLVVYMWMDGIKRYESVA